MDALLDVVVGGEAMLLHLEFQTYNDLTMPERLLRYNVLARSEYQLPVYSCVIYLLKDGDIQQSPLYWTVPTGQEVLQFTFASIEIGSLSSQDIIKMGQPGLLPFLPLTSDGAEREVVLQMFKELEPVDNKELALVGFTLSSLIFRRSNVLDWE